MQNSSTKPSIQQRIKNQELAIRLLESLNRDQDRTGSKPANLDRITKMRGDLAVLYSQEKAARSLPAKDKGFMGPVTNLTSSSKKVGPSDFQSMLKRVNGALSLNSGSTKSNSAKGQSYDFMPALMAAHKQVGAEEATSRNKPHPRLAADEREIQYNGKKIVIKFPGVALDPDVTKKRIELFAKDNPKSFLRYRALLAQQRAETNPVKRIELGVRSRNLILTGHETGSALGAQTYSEPTGNIWNGLERSVDAVDEAINHPGDRIRKAIKSGTIPDNAYTRANAAFSDIYHPMTGFFGSPEDVQKAVGGVTGSIAKHLTNWITTPTDASRKFIENHMKPGVLRDAVGLLSGATGTSKAGQILSLVPGALDIPNWSGTKAIMAPKKYFDEGSALLDHDSLENRLLFGLHVAGPVGDILGFGVDGIVPNGIKQLFAKRLEQKILGSASEANRIPLAEAEINRIRGTGGKTEVKNPLVRWDTNGIGRSFTPKNLNPSVGKLSANGGANYKVKALRQRPEYIKRNANIFDGLFDTAERDVDGGPLLGGHPVKRIDPSKLVESPASGKLIGIDGKPINIHHSEDGFVEMTHEEHIGKGNKAKNHPGGTGPAPYDPTIYRKYARRYKADPWNQSRKRKK